jgi:hypothetical protein
MDGYKKKPNINLIFYNILLFLFNYFNYFILFDRFIKSFLFAINTSAVILSV